MKTISLFSLFALSIVTANGQWSIGAQAGGNKQFIKGIERPINSSVKNDFQTSPTFIGSVYAVTEKDRHVNFGVGLSVRTHNMKWFFEETRYNGQINGFDIDHQSVFVSIHPILDLSIDKKRIFHVLINPNLGFLAAGNENGYRQYISGERTEYVNTADNINKFALGLSAQLQVRYPITKQLKATAAAGYSINNSVSKYMPHESGNVFFQLGVNFCLPQKKSGEKPTEEK